METLFDEGLGFEAPAWDDPDPPFNKVSFPHPQEVQRPSPKCDPLIYWTLEQEKCYKWTQIPSILISRGWHPTLLRHTEVTREEPPWRPRMAAPLPDEEDYLWLRTRRIPVDFPKFCELPVNVRMMIWAQAIATDPRVFEMQHPDLHLYDQNGMEVKRPQQLVRPRALASVCIESRLQFVKVDLGRGDNYLMNFDADIIYFGPESYWWHETWWRPPPGEAEQYGSSIGDYHSGRGWQKKQLWNHWRYGEDNKEIGEEQICDPYQIYNQNRDQTRHWKDPYHPLLSASHYEFERRQIKNVAVDLEFWQETWERRSAGQTDLLSKFPCAKKFILAAGDVGDSLHLERTDKGPAYLVDMKYFPRFKENCIDRHPGVIYEGQINFHSAAVQTSLFQDVIDMTVDGGGKYPTPVTMFVTRGGKYRGHLSRLIENQLPPSCKDDDGDDDDYDMDDFDDDDPLAWALLDVCDNDNMDARQEDNDKRDDLVELRKILGRRELSDLLYGRDNPPPMCELEEQRAELNAEFQGMGPVEAFHAMAPVPADEDTEDEVYDDEDADEEEELGDEDAPYETHEDTIVFDHSHAGYARFAAAGPKAAGENNTMGVEGDNKPKTVDKNAVKANNKKGVKADQKDATNAGKRGGFVKKALKPPYEGEKLGIIMGSKIQYSYTLTYQVTWINEQGKHRPDKQRWPHNHPLLENDYCRALIAAFHEAHPNADNKETTVERAPYGSRTKNGVKKEDQPASVPQQDEANDRMDIDESIENDSRSASTPQQDEANDKMDIDQPIEIDSRLSTPLTTPPSSPLPSSEEQQEAFHDAAEDQDDGYAIVVDKSRFAPRLASNHPSPCPSSSKMQSSEAHDKMDIDGSGHMGAANRHPTHCF